MNPGELLERIAATLKRDIGPAVESEYPKTQAFMAAVVLQKLGRQLALAETHRAADAAELQALHRDLETLLASGSAPSTVQAAVSGLVNAPPAAALCALITALYAARSALGDARFDALLARVRISLRASIDRRMEYAE